jgi:dynein assembly factor with WDR repeat domains 1
VEVLVNQIVFEEPLISASRKGQLRRLIYRLIEKHEANERQDFYLYKILRAHILPLTNCAFNKAGDKFITGSYDRTCKVWATSSGDELLTLEGHKNVVYAIAFNNPFGDKIVTGSFDKTAKLWNAETGQCIRTMSIPDEDGSTALCAAFLPGDRHVVAGSKEGGLYLFDLASGECIDAHPDAHEGPLWSLAIGPDTRRRSCWLPQMPRQCFCRRSCWLPQMPRQGFSRRSCWLPQMP